MPDLEFKGLVSSSFDKKTEQIPTETQVGNNPMLKKTNMALVDLNGGRTPSPSYFFDPISLRSLHTSAGVKEAL